LRRGHDAFDATAAAARFHPAHPGGGEATAATVLRAEAVGRLTEAIEELPERLRLVLSLHYIEDLTYREIAGILEFWPSNPSPADLKAQEAGNGGQSHPGAPGARR
jgi:DNA-directed RNA polymerase specialized sigma24 family protein